MTDYFKVVIRDPNGKVLQIHELPAGMPLTSAILKAAYERNSATVTLLGEPKRLSPGTLDPRD